jgi:hypothetical protein
MSVFSPGEGDRFLEAIEARDVKTPVPSGMTSAEWREVQAELRERALFSARVTDAEFLSWIDRQTRLLLDGETNPATARLKLKQYLEASGYETTPEAAGTITDFGSDARLNLILRTNAQMAQGYGWFMQGQSEAVLDEWPCQELVRTGTRKEPREWEERWQAACGEAEDAAAQRVFDMTGRMIARKDSPVWQAIADGAGGYEDTLGQPYPPFAFNSGMGVRDIDRDESMQLDLIGRDEQIEPQTRGFNEDLAVSPDVRAEDLRQSLIEDLGEGYEFDGDELVRIA